jgi:hypothetical protein
MSFAPHVAAIHAALGRPAVYTPPGGDAVALRAVRAGGGQPISYGAVTVVLDRVRFEVLRSAVQTPVAGATLVVDGETFTVDGIQPVQRDAHGLKWSLDVSWGVEIVWRSVTGSGATQNPPSTSGGVTVAANAATGAAVISLRSTYAVGKLLPGDVVTVAGADYAVNAAAQASANVFSAVGITPALAADVVLGAPASLGFAHDTAIRAAVSGYQARELQGGVSAGDIRLVLLPAALSALPEAPKLGDLAIIPGIGTLRVVNTAPVYSGASVAALEVQARR